MVIQQNPVREGGDPARGGSPGRLPVLGGIKGCNGEPVCARSEASRALGHTPKGLWSYSSLIHQISYSFFTEFYRFLPIFTDFSDFLERIESCQRIL